jgi:hypothetical protein
MTNTKSMSSFTRPLTLAALSALAALQLTCSADQPKVPCTTAHGTFSVKYTLVSGTGECAMLSAGLMGVQPYSRKGSDGQASFDKPPVALKTDEVGDLVSKYSKQTVDVTKTYSLGEFMTQEPGSDNFCQLGPSTAAELNLAAVAAGVDAMGMPTPALPAVQVKYEWSNVRFYVSPSVLGTQFSADLAYTKNGCMATYKVRAVYPSISCGKEVKDPVTMMTSVVKDANLCSPCPDPTMGRSSGSGLNPDFDIVCDDASLLCLTTKDPPSLAATPIVCK